MPFVVAHTLPIGAALPSDLSRPKPAVDRFRKLSK